MLNQYPAATWIPASQSNFRKANRICFARIVIHATDGHADPVATAAMWQEPGHGSSAHFVVGQDGTVVQAVSIADIAWHAHAANALSVGIEHSARTPKELGPGDPGMPPTEIQLDASARLSLWLCEQADLEPSRDVVKGHAEIDPQTTHSDCPTGAGIDLDAYVARMQAIMAAPFA